MITHLAYMRRIILSIFLIIIFCGAFFLFWKVGSGVLYSEYTKLWEYRRLHPELLPDARAIRTIDAGHDTLYADFLWINMIQYIGDNIGNGKFNEYAPPLLRTITDLHPYFTKAYVLSVLLSPPLDEEKPTYEKNKRIAEDSLLLSIEGMEKTCDREKIKIITGKEIGTSLWSDTTLQNPCRDGMLPYYIAYVASALSKEAEAEKYYKIASMNTDAPQASRFLSLLMRAKSGDHIEAAKKFLFIAIDGYDEDPYTCRMRALDILKRVEGDLIISLSTLDFLEKNERALVSPKDTQNPLASSATNCYDSTKRGIKQVYLAYIKNASLPFPEITKGEELLKKKIIPFIPKLQEQKAPGEDWSVEKGIDGTWKYKKIYKN